MSSDPWPDPKEWVSIEECIEHVMRSRGCSRRTARRIVTAHIKAKHVEAKFFRQKSSLIPLTPAEAIKRLNAGEDSSLHVTLTNFVKCFRLTWEELLGELRAGRLIAEGTESDHLQMELNNRVNPNRITVTVEAIREWIDNPETPSQLYSRRMLS